MLWMHHNGEQTARRFRVVQGDICEVWRSADGGCSLQTKLKPPEESVHTHYKTVHASFDNREDIFQHVAQSTMSWEHTSGFSIHMPEVSHLPLGDTNIETFIWTPLISFWLSKVVTWQNTALALWAHYLWYTLKAFLIWYHLDARMNWYDLVGKSQRSNLPVLRNTC